VSSIRSKEGFRRCALGAALIVTLGVGGAACSTSSPKTAPLPTVAGFSETPTSTLRATPQKGAPAPAAAITAVSKYELAHGPKLGTWLLTAVRSSTADPAYVMFRVGPAAPNDTNVQAGYGFAHLAGSTWTVVGFGSDAVGCPPGAAGNAVVPPAVISSFGLSC